MNKILFDRYGIVELENSKEARSIRQNQHTDIQTTFDQAFKHHQAGQLQDALALYQQIQASLDSNPQFLYLFGTLHGQIGQLETAVDILEKYISLDSRNAAAFNNRGKFLQDLKRLDEALLSVNKAIALKPDYAEAYNNQGIALQDLRQLDEALLSYDKAIALKPDYADAYFNRGSALKELMKLKDALLSYERAIEINPFFSEAYGECAAILKNLGIYDLSLFNCNRAIALKPDYAEAYYNRGNVLIDLKRMDEALLSYEKAIMLKPDFAEAFNNRGNVFKDLKRLDEALLSYEKAIMLKPDFAEAFNNRGVVLKDLKQYDESIFSHNRAIALKPDYADAYNNRGVALQSLNRLDEALSSYDKAIVLKPDCAEAYNNRGNALKDLKRLDEALLSYDKAIVLKPDYAEAYNNQGVALQDLKRLDEALLSYNKAIALKPDYVESHFNLGMVLKDLNRLEEALLSYDKAIAQKPEFHFCHGYALHTRMHLCDWQDIAAQTELIWKGTEDLKHMSVPFPLLAIADSPQFHQVASEIYIKEKYPSSPIQREFVAAKDISKIKIGYFSADFHSHATMLLMADLFDCHDKNRFEVIAFSFGPNTNDAWQQRAWSGFSQFIDCNNKSDAEIAKMSENLGVHIAVDLKGFTTDSRTGIFAHRPAPIQVNFIGYPGTMGANYIDYIIADEVLIPEDSRKFYAEKVAYLPDCYQPNCQNRDVSTKKITRSDFDLPEKGFVFSSFNNNYKITPDIFRSWIRILREVDGSVLWLLTSNATAEKNLKTYLEQGGIDPDRLIFAQKIPVEEHLNRLLLADLMLDTFPYGAHTTCSDALRMGLPVITLTGESFASRVAASLLTTVGLPELITESLADYESLAIKLAKNPEQLKGIQDRLQQNIETSPLYNTELFARNLELLYETMYQRYADGLELDHIMVGL